MKEKLYVFISSTMTELGPERDMLAKFMPQIDLPGFEVHPWIFEYSALPQDESIQKVYLEALRDCKVYIGLFWNQYGKFTIDEFVQATAYNIERHIYVKDVDADKRDPRLSEFLKEISDVTTGITSKWFETNEELLTTIKNALLNWVDRHVSHQPSSLKAQLFDQPEQIPLHTKLIGRDGPHQTVLNWLQAGQQVVIQGMGGMGKTTLSYSILQAWLALGKNALWLKAGSADADTLFEIMLKELNPDQITSNDTADLEHKQRVIRELLLEKKIDLVVLDNVWNGKGLSGVIGALPAKMPLLITARQRYSLQNIISLNELSDTDALLVLSHYAGSDFPDARQKEAAKELCDVLGNHPLALELAGRNLKVMMNDPRPTALLKEIRDAPHTMKSPDIYSEGEQRTIKYLLDTSLHMIDADDEHSRKVFLACGAFYIPKISQPLLALYLDKSIPLDASLKTLVVNGLLTVNYIETDEDEIAVYSLHDLAFSYARAQATDADKTRAFDACLAFAQEYAEKTTYIDVELTNLLSAVRVASADKQSEKLIALMRIIATKGYMDEHGHTLPLLTHLDKAIEVARALRETHLEDLHYLVSKRANAYYQRGDLENAATYYHEAATTAKELGLEARYFLGLCMTYGRYSDLGRIEEAEKGLHELQVLAEGKDIPNDMLLAEVYEAWSYHYIRHDNYEKCRPYAMKEVEVGRRMTDDPTSLFHGLTNWGIAEKFLGNPTKGKELLEEALGIGREYDVPLWQALALHALAEIWLGLDDTAQALTIAQQALSLFQDIGFTARIADVEKFIVEVQTKGEVAS